MLEQKLYTVADVAELTGLTSRTIRNYLKDGTLRGKKIGVQWRFTEEDINRLFSEGETGGRKVLHPKDVISDFLKGTDRKGIEGCLVLDIPFSNEEDGKKYMQKLERMAAKKEGEISIACEVLEEAGMLRTAISGNSATIIGFAARMREI